MRRALRVSPEAQRSLDEIARWTAGQFGARQARLYGAMLVRTMGRIRAGTAAHRSVRDVLAPRAPADLRFVKAGAHYILFRERDGRVEVTDVLHEAMDVAGRVRGSDGGAPGTGGFTHHGDRGGGSISAAWRTITLRLAAMRTHRARYPIAARHWRDQS